MSDLSKQALWYAFGLAALASILALRIGANFLVLVPVLLTWAALASRAGKVGNLVRLACALGYAGFIVVGSFSVGRIFVPSFIALVAALVLRAR